MQRQSLILRREILGLGRSREFDVSQIRDLRILPLPLGDPRDLSLGSEGVIAFDYGAKTFRFGAALAEAEAKQLLQTLHTRCPALRLAAG